MAFTGPVEDRLAIRELIDSYSDAVTQRDSDAWGANWAEDSRWCLPDLGVPEWADIRGKQKIVEEWNRMMGAFHGEDGEPAVCTFLCIPGAMDVTGDTAAPLLLAAALCLLCAASVVAFRALQRAWPLPAD